LVSVPTKMYYLRHIDGTRTEVTKLPTETLWGDVLECVQPWMPGKAAPEITLKIGRAEDGL
jgi:hypothetical protein